ncbi:DUF2306 domain-containing protein [Phaeobacter sp. QD34_3]|uniref:DUF2306 domain-containing protein n=1 Tax=unclassified Phaeobacter TaxID=2621772 RepID=UPI00237F13E2|nr:MULTISPECIES: DUF2306 domain-containing protein [unclassified Phaeobacter]MDE4133775.1 DUF2306 domain-containing protein [Phaeobacter sp. QD34_3]MDE4137292.1 DUF2306 domain-containing protein [Phaeobacter sp. QD34_24]
MPTKTRIKDYPKWVVTAMWVSALLIAVGSYRFLIADIALVMPAMLHHALERPLMFYLHIGLAPIALALLPLQFSNGLRKARPAVHRWLGRLYGAAILLAGVSGLWLAYTTEEGPVAALGLGLLSLAWLWTTGVAIRHAMARRIAQHRVWMIRSAALTLAAVTLRIYLPIGAVTVGFEASYPIICWLAWVPNLVLAEWILRRGRGAPVGATA